MDDLKEKKLIEIVLASFEAEKNGDAQKGKQLIDDDFTVTEMCEWYDGTVFRRLAGEEMKKLMEHAYTYKGREYQFVQIAANDETQTVFVEFVETYPDPKTGQIYRTPQVAVCQLRDNKLYRTRHYMDPRLSLKKLSEDQIKQAIS